MLSQAFLYLNSNPGCQLVLTNDDYSMSLKGGGSIPGEGAIASVLYGARKDLKPLIVVSDKVAHEEQGDLFSMPTIGQAS